MSQQNNFDAGFEKPVSNMWKPGRPADVIKGVYIGFKETISKYNDEITKIHEVSAIAGGFHNIIENEVGDSVVSEKETPVKEGESYFFYEKNTFADDIAKAKHGQQIIVRFVEMRKPQASGSKPYKYLECKLGPMDKAYAKEHGGADGNDIKF